MPEKISSVLVRLVSTLVLTSLVFVAGCNLFTSNEERLRKAQTYLEKGELNAAAIEFKNILKNEPDNLQARWLLGKAYLDMNDGPGAKKELRRAQSLGKSDDEILVALVRADLLTDDLNEAMALLQDVPEGAWDASKLALRGEVELGLGQFDKARGSFRASLDADAGSLQARYGLIRLAFAERDFDEAGRQVDQVLSQKKDDFQGLVYKAELEFDRGAPEQAIEFYKRALALRNSLFVRLGMVRAYLVTGKIAEAEAQLLQLDKIAPDNLIARYLRAVVAKQRNDLSTAKELLLEVVSKAPDYYPGQLLLGSVQYDLGEYEQSATQLTHYLANNSDQVPAKKLLAQTYLKLRDEQRAIELLESAAVTDPTDPQLMAMLGSLYANRREYAKSEDYYRKALELKPGEKEIETRLALNRWASGDQDQAIAELSAIVASDKDYVPAELALISAHMSSREYAKALAAAKSLIEKRRDYPVGYALAAAASMELGEREQARDYLEKSIQVDGQYTNGYLALARMELEEGKADAARQRLESALEKRPGSEQLLLALASLEGQQGHLERFKELLMRAKDGNPRALAPRMLLAGTALRESRFDEARSLLKEAKGIAPGNPRVLLLQAEVEQKSGNAKAALAVYDNLLARYPKLLGAHLKRGDLLRSLGDPQKARDAYQAALALDDQNIGGRWGLGEVELKLGHGDKAVALAKGLKSEYGDNPAGYFLMGDVLLAGGEPGKAVTEYRQAHKLAESRASLLRLSSALVGAGEGGEAADLQRQWLQKNPGDAAVRLNYAGLQQSRGKVDEAIAEYRQLLARQPDQVVAMNNLAWLYHTQGKPAEAMALAERAYKAAPEVPGILDTYGWILVNGEGLAQGLSLLERAVAKRPGDLDMRYHLAAAYARSGGTARAKSDLEKILSSEEPFSERENARRLLDSLR